MYNREIKSAMLRYAKQYPALAILGPRQSGKTTLARMVFPKKKYLNLEDTELREFAKTDPKGFLGDTKDGLILDEIQRVPELLSHLQVMIDKEKKLGKYILTGSHNILMMEGISQTLAGRISLLKLLPLSTAEIFKSSKSILDYTEYIYKGFYPALYQRKMDISVYYQNYIQTYIEKDVRSLKNITDLGTFQKFIRLCGARIGGILNLSSLADDAGISHNTAKAWINVLEAGYILFQIFPHSKNFGKRLIKSPKIYFYDTGLLCAVLGIKSADQIQTHYLKGSIFENFIISEITKHYFNKGTEPSLYIWRDKHGKEIDCILESGSNLFPIEIKSGKTISPDYFANLNYYKAISNNEKKGTLIYGGKEMQKRTDTNVYGWKDLVDMLKDFVA